MSTTPKTAPCGDCRMSVPDGFVYHPYAACLMFKACKDPTTVEANLAAVVGHGVAQERERALKLIEASHKAVPAFMQIREQLLHSDDICDRWRESLEALKRQIEAGA